MRQHYRTNKSWITPERALEMRAKSQKMPSLDKLKEVDSLNDEDVRRLGSLYLTSTITQLQYIEHSDELLGIEKVIIRTILKAAKFGDFARIEPLLSRIMGKVATLNINHAYEPDDKYAALDTIPREEIVRLVQQASGPGEADDGGVA